ncbi:MAG TPA: TIGR01212 family radical SAM protein [Candidatus Merdenecus merdavium]|nr:TIGR01212 family radical SAM protein [Candidatus Merdenecus merdavium]
MNWDNRPYYSFDFAMKEQFHEKIYKLSIHGGMTCPNRDGTLDDRGCIFCSGGGSGDFAADPSLSIQDQVNAQKNLRKNKVTGQHFIAYFQAFTNTYAPVDYLRKLFYAAIELEEVVGLSIATRPDCLPEDVLDLLEELSKIKPVWVELGLQTIHSNTAEFIRRRYPLSVFDHAVKELSNRRINIVVHTILGLPGETKAQMLQTIQYLNFLPISGVKLQLLHVLKNTDLGMFYQEQPFHIFTLEEYIDLVINCLEQLSPNIVVHRLTGDGPKSLLLAPLWSTNKKLVLGTLHKELKLRNTWQGRLFCP